MFNIDPTKKQAIDNSKAKHEGVDYQGYKVPLDNNAALLMMQVKNAFEMGVTSTNIEFSNGTIMPMEATEFQEFAIWFVTKRNSFFI